MIIEKPYDQPQLVGFLSSIDDDDKCIGFRKLDGAFLPLIGDVTSADIASVSQDAMHELETIAGLYVHDGKPSEQFQLKFEKLDTLRHVVNQLTAHT